MRGISISNTILILLEFLTNCISFYISIKWAIAKSNGSVSDLLNRNLRVKISENAYL
jgi:hypothetical protein